MRPLKRDRSRPVLITEASVSGDDAFDRRRKRYLIMMLLRALCIVGAAVSFRASGWAAAGFVAAAVVLPWTAVLLANDRPPREAVRFRRFLSSERRAQPRALGSADRADADTEAGPGVRSPSAESDRGTGV